ELASADLSCIVANGSRSLLIDEQTSCPAGAKLEILATVPGKHWSRIAFFACDLAHCRLAHSSALGPSSKATISFENDGPPGERRGILVLSRKQVLPAATDAFRAADVAGLRHLDRLDLAFESQQIPFSFVVSDGK
ncbi:MAG TPA: hypothetical protein VGL19_21950, partial [Polyangiaceae bacterium]